METSPETDRARYTFVFERMLGNIYPATNWRAEADRVLSCLVTAGYPPSLIAGLYNELMAYGDRMKAAGVP